MFTELRLKLIFGFFYPASPHARSVQNDSPARSSLHVHSLTAYALRQPPRRLRLVIFTRLLWSLCLRIVARSTAATLPYPRTLKIASYATLAHLTTSTRVDILCISLLHIADEPRLTLFADFLNRLYPAYKLVFRPT